MKGLEINNITKNQDMIAGQTFELTHQKGIVEALIFAAYEPITSENLAKTTNLSMESIAEIINELNNDYAAGGRSFRIEEIGGGYRMFTLPEYHHYINRAIHKEKRLSLSQASLETLAIVAYKQPVTKLELERIRGVDCDGVLRNLIARGLIRIDGRSVAPGKPMLYSTTEYFLEFFGLSSIDDLPPLPSLEQFKENLPKLKLIRKGERDSGDELQLDLDEQVEESETDKQNDIFYNPPENEPVAVSVEPENKFVDET
ncbi:MAG: SMC-Scp complex subunit ScpB [candidate division Zixibacteria bacterium]|nr:SMC-Scp complex subunit ScpB [candidate division Zixibacteria bacterium]